MPDYPTSRLFLCQRPWLLRSPLSSVGLGDDLRLVLGGRNVMVLDLSRLGLLFYNLAVRLATRVFPFNLIASLGAFHV